MDEPCFCTVEDILSCLVDKTKISLPVLITACALGYIWVARKNMSDMKKQCDVLEDDMNHIKKENYQIVEEIRRLKCAASDTQLLASTANKCRSRRSRSRTNQCFSKRRSCDKKDFSDGDRCTNRRKKEKMSRNRSSSCTRDDQRFMSCSNPDVYPNSFKQTSLMKPSSECSEIHSTRFRPRAESTKLERRTKEYDCDECPFTSFPTSDKQHTFCEPSFFEPKTKTINMSNGNSKHRPLKKTKHICHSPENLNEPFNCCRYVEGPKTTNNLDMCMPELTPFGVIKNKTKKQKRQLFKPNIYNCPFTCDNNFTSKIKESTMKKAPKCPISAEESLLSCCESKSSQLKRKIDKYKKELACDLISSNCNPCQRKKPKENISCNISSNGQRCQSRNI